MGLVTMRMGDDMVAALKEVAARRHLPYQTLMRSWVAERLEQEQRALAAEPDGKDTDGARRLG
jgi:predicted transcriptional regulator